MPKEMTDQESALGLGDRGVGIEELLLGPVVEASGLAMQATVNIRGHKTK